MIRESIYRVESDDPSTISPDRVTEIYSMLSAFMPEADKSYEDKGRNVIPLKWLGRIRGNQFSVADVIAMISYFRNIIAEGREKWTNNSPQLFTDEKANVGFRDAALSTLDLAERTLKIYAVDFIAAQRGIDISAELEQ